MHIKLIGIALWLLALRSPVLSQKIRPEIKEIAEGFSKQAIAKTFGSEQIELKTLQAEKYAQLNEKATADELIALTDYYNPVVRCFAFEALIARKEPRVFPVLLKHLMDTLEVRLRIPCSITSEKVGDYFLELTDKNSPGKGAYQLSEREKAIADSILIFDKNIRLSAKSKALDRIKILSNNAYTLQNTLQNRFENGLSTHYQLKDSVPKHYNIYNRMKLRKVPAVSVAVIKNGSIVLSKAYGYANIEKNIKADSNTLFHFASISKTANALCVLKLAEEGKISLDTDFRQYIKDGSFKENKYSKGQTITIRNFLSHTAGINRDDGPSGDYTHNKPLPNITQIVKGEKPALGNGAYSIRKPNEAYEYSNQAICIVQKILADNFDADYNRLLTQKILHPLKMSNSTFALKLDTLSKSKLAEGYVFDYKAVPPYVFPCQSEGGLVATTNDIARMVIAIQNACTGKDNSLLKKESIQKMFTPQLGTASYTGNLDVPYKNGLGVMLFEKGGRQYFTHSGSIDGYTAVYVGSLDGKDGAVIVINTSYAGIIGELLSSIAETFGWEHFVEHKYRQAVVPTKEKWNAFVGTYKLNTKKGEFISTITRAGEHLYIQNTYDGMPEQLYFSSDNTAFVLSRDYTIEFAVKKKKNVLVFKNNGNFSGEAVETGVK